MAKLLKGNALLLIPLRLPEVKSNQDLRHVILLTLRREALTLKDGDVIAVASKTVSVWEHRIVKLEDVDASARAKRIAKKQRMDERLVQLVLNEADMILGGVRGFLLTVKDGIMAANAGIDLKNSPIGTATLWPDRPDRSASLLRRFLEHEYGVTMGVVLVDSRIPPMRLGTTGLAIGLSGFVPLKDDRAKPDLFGRKVQVTRTALADDLAAAAHLLMGERDERIGLVLIRNAPLLRSERASSRLLKLHSQRCLFASNLPTGSLSP